MSIPNLFSLLQRAADLTSSKDNLNGILAYNSAGSEANFLSYGELLSHAELGADLYVLHVLRMVHLHILGA